jgi:hypothetical protein
MMTLVAKVVRMRNLDLRSVHLRVVLPAFVGVAEGEVERRENDLGNWQTRRMKTDGVCYCRGWYCEPAVPGRNCYLDVRRGDIVSSEEMAE